MKRNIGLLVAFCIFTLESFAQTWTGSVSSDWHTAGNWNPAGVPGALGDVTINSGAPNQPTVSANVNIKTLTLNGGTLSVMGSANMTTQGRVELDSASIFNLGSGSLTVGGHMLIPGGTFNGDSGTLTCTKRLEKSGGTFNAGTGTVEMAGNGSFDITGTGSFTFHNFTLLSGANLMLPSTFAGVVDTRAFSLAGDSSFTLLSGATLRTANPNGVDSSITTTGTKSFSTTANYEFNGTTPQSTGSNMPTMVNNLWIDNAAGVTLSQTTEVNGTLSLVNGTVTTGANMLTVNAPGSISGGSASSYVNGRLARVYPGAGSKDFPVGGSASYRPVTFNYAALTGTSTVTVENFASGFPGTAPSGFAQVGTRYWNVTQSGASSFMYDITLDGSGLTFSGRPHILKHDTGTTVALVAGSPNYTATGLTSPSDFAFAETHIITASALGPGSISPGGSVNVAPGGSQQFTFTANAGAYLDSVCVNGLRVDSTASYTFSNVAGDQTITAYFSPNTYTITATAGTNGSISPEGTVVVNQGDDRSFTITPDTGYDVDSVVVDGVLVDSTTNYTFVNVVENHTIRATFVLSTYTINVSAGPNGTISPGGTVVVNYGENQTFTITPDSGYLVDSVFVDGIYVDSTTSYTFTNVTWNHTISATFDVILSASEFGAGMPQSFALFQNFPNPFNPSTEIRFDLKERGNVQMIVYDAVGRMVEVLVDETMQGPAHYTVRWDASNHASGMYFVRLVVRSETDAPVFHSTKKVMLVK